MQTYLLQTHLLQVQVLEVPFAGHAGWGGGAYLDGVMDYLDFVREPAAMISNMRTLIA